MTRTWSPHRRPHPAADPGRGSAPDPGRRPRRRRTVVYAVALLTAGTLTAGCSALSGAGTGPGGSRPRPAVSAKAPLPAGSPLGTDSPLTPPTGTDDADPTRVALDWARTAYAYDTAYDTGPHDAVLRAARFLTSALAAHERRYRPASGAGAEWNTWAGHRAWTSVRVRVDDDAPAAADGSEAAVVTFRQVVVVGTATGRDGWHGTGPRLVAGLAMVRTTSAGGWRIAQVTATEAARPPGAPRTSSAPPTRPSGPIPSNQESR